MALSDQTRLEAQIGFLCGTLIGALAGEVFVVGFTNWQWYFKALSIIGAIGIEGNIAFGIWEMMKMRKNIIEVNKQIAEINKGPSTAGYIQ